MAFCKFPSSRSSPASYSHCSLTTRPGLARFGGLFPTFSKMATVSQPCPFSGWSDDATEMCRAHDRRGIPHRGPNSTQDSNHTSREFPSNSIVNDAPQTNASHLDPRKALGLHPKAPLDQDKDMAERQHLRWSRVRTVLREPFVEFWGVVIMVVFGNGATAQVLLSTAQATAPGGNGYGSYQNINWG
jgi:hypothetical protein